MAINFVSTSNGGATGTSTTVSHTIASGSNRLLITAVECQAADDVTGVTFNGTSMTQYVKLATTVASYYNYIYYLVAPTVTTANIVSTTGSSRTTILLSCNYTGVDQTTPLEANSAGTATSTNPTRSVTTLTNNAWLFGTIRVNAAIPSGTGANTTYRNNWASDGGFRISDSNSDQTPTGSYAQNWTSGTNQLYAMIVVSIKPASTNNGAGFLAFF